MKNQLKLWKSGLVALFLFIFTNGVYAQLAAPDPTLPISNKAGLNLGTLDDGAGTVTDQTNTVLFYNPTGTSLTLQASLTDENDLEFTSYIWYKLSWDGTDETPTEVADETENALELTGLQPGYYKYRVYGLIEDGSVSCQSDEFQDIIFFVLRPLDPTVTVGAGAVDQFCIDEPPTTGLQLNASVAFDAAVDYQGGYPNPAAGEFDITYRWYTVNTATPLIQIDLPGNVSTTDGAAHTFTLNDYSNLLTPGTYNFYVEVQYSNAIKDRETREHALWRKVVGGDTPFELVVTPVPGRPTITIVDIID